MKTILSSVEPMTDSELNEMKEKDHQRWLDRTLDELVNCARTDKEFAKKLCKKITELSYGKRELSKILKSKAISGSGRYPPIPIYWNHLLVLHYALIIYHSEHDDYRKRSRDAIEWLIQYYYRLTGRKIKYATMNDKVSKAINAENIDEYDDWVQDVIRERRKRAPPCLNK